VTRSALQYLLHWYYSSLLSQFSAAVVRHEANDGVVCGYAIWTWLKYDTKLSEMDKPVRSTSRAYCRQLTIP